jgi:ketosteroid isomerase-like protein
LACDDQISGGKLRMPSSFDARNFANDWIAAWNSHDLEAILSHYAPEVTLTSPLAAKLTGESSGTICGKDALRLYFAKGLEFFPNLEFTLIDVMQGVWSIVVYYKNQRDTRTGEFMEFDEESKVVRVVANYSL